MSLTDFNQKKFIKDVRAFMKKNGLSCRAFAKLSGIAFITIYRLEKNENEISLKTWRKLEKAMKSYKSDII